MRRALLALALVAGCGTPAAAPPALTGELTQYRRDQALDRFQVGVTADREVVVEGARLLAPGYADGPAVALDVTVPPGSRVDLPVPYGAPDCRSGVGPAVAELSLRGGDRVRVELGQPPVLVQVRERECRERRVAEAVELSLAPLVEGPGPVLRTALRLDRRVEGEPVVVEDVGGHVLFTLRGEGLPLVLGPDEGAAEVPLTVTTTRCDGHALAESKRTGLLLFYVGVGEDVPRRTEVAATPEQAAQLAAFATRSCGLS